MKHLNYGNNRTLDITYNARLQASTFQIPNLINKSYQYHADGSVKYSQDLLDAKFDRYYGYDQASRITQAFSGAETRKLPIAAKILPLWALSWPTVQ